MRVQIHETRGLLIVQRERGDSVCCGGGCADHGWGAEHQLMYRIKQRLNQCGFHLIKKRMQRDGHLWGEVATPYLRAASRDRRYPHIYIYDPDYVFRNSAKAFNAGEQVVFVIVGNIWDDVEQLDWFDICRGLLL